MLDIEKCWEQCWSAVQKRDRQQDGRFFYGVVTTGVYCRPSCPSRHALRQNVRFYETPEEAERDGLRPCLRCHPLEIAGGAEARQMRELCRYIEEHAAGRLGENAGRLGGDAGWLGGAAGRRGGAAGRLGGAAGRLGGDAGRPGGDAGRLGGDAGRLGGDAGRLGGDGGRRGSDGGPRGGAAGRRGGDAGRLGGDAGRLGGDGGRRGGAAGRRGGDAGRLDGDAGLLDENAGRLDLAALAARAGLSRFHLQRRFKAIVGVTPREYGEACRMRRLKSELRQSQDVTEAVYAAGFGSSSRVYERADTRLGMTPNQYRRGGEGMAISYASAPTPVGLMMLAATDRGLCFLQFGESEEALAAALHGEYSAAQIAPMSEARGAEFREWMEALRQHLEGLRPQLDLPLDIRATAFQVRVWNYLQGIPYGQVRSYAQVAAGIGSPTATRAVARACASNTVALAIPCHRVIRGSGELGGYRWGLERKQALLGRERALAARSA